jgi:hypothetical protein
MEKLVRELPRDRHAFQKKQRRMYDCKTLQFSNTQQIMPDPEAAVSGWGELFGSSSALIAAVMFGLSLA